MAGLRLEQSIARGETHERGFFVLLYCYRPFQEDAGDDS